VWNFHRIDLSYLSLQVLHVRLITSAPCRISLVAAAANNLQQRFPQISEAPFAYYNLGLYAQDEWRVNPQLSLTLRYAPTTTRTRYAR